MVRIIDNYTLYEIIGQGNYGKVYRGVNRDDNQQYAIKVVESKKFKLDRKLEEYTINQINILTNIQHSPHIIRYYGMLKSTNNFYFVYEFCNNGTLAELIQKKKYIKENQALKIFNQLIEAFKVLQKNHVMHRDLKPDNIFFNNQTVKLGDFGFCKSLGQNTVTRTMLGSPVYMAPQVLRGQKYTNKADIWSIGVVLYEMLYGYCPFQSTSINKLIQAIETCQVCFQETIKVSPETKQLISKLLTKDVRKRMNWGQLFEIKITENGEYVKKEQVNVENCQPRSLSFTKSLNKLKGLKPFAKRPQTSQGHFTQNNFLKERSPSIFNKKMKTQVKQQQSRQKNISLKMVPIQQDTDDESLKTKFMRRKQNSSGMKQQPAFLQKNRKNEDLRLVYYKPNPIKQVNNSKITISNEHKDITKGITISKLFATSGLRHSRLFTQLILTIVVDRLIYLKQKGEQQSTVPELINLINSELMSIQAQLGQMKRSNEQNTKLIDSHKNDLIPLLKQKVPECKNSKLCYQMICYLLKLPMQRLSTNQMKEQLQKVLCCTN